MKEKLIEFLFKRINTKLNHLQHQPEARDVIIEDLDAYFQELQEVVKDLLI